MKESPKRKVIPTLPRSLKKHAITIAIVILALTFPIYYLYFRCKTQDWLTAFMTFYLAAATVTVIWWQGQQLRKQLELQVLTELFKEWNSDGLKDKRKKSFDDDADLDTKESILEFLERIASYYLAGVISEKLIWDTIGWYILRYYYYYREMGIIEKVRDKWGKDDTLYSDLEELYHDLSRTEIRLRNISVDKLEQQLRRQKDEFKKTEKKQ